MEPPPLSDDDPEDGLIEVVLRARPATAGADPQRPRLDAGDDAAVLADGTTVTVDALVEGVHFDDRLSPADVGFKTVAVSVSDLIATGARPAWAVLTLALPAADHRWVAGFATGLGEACAAFGLRLVGGDTVRSTGPRMVSLTAGGTLVGAPLTRSGARADDALWVTGTLGLAGAGWARANPPDVALAALRRPSPPLAFGLALAAAGLATAGLDLSDGLARDLPRLCTASGVGAVVEPALLPGHPALGPDPLPDQTRGGEDYQLLFTAPPDAEPALRALAARHGTRLTRIGRCTTSPAVRLDGAAWPAPRFAHFHREPEGSA